MRLVANLRRWLARGTRDPRTKSELYEEARRLGIPGRSTMRRRELAEAIALARRAHRPPRLFDRFRAGSSAAVGVLVGFRSRRPRHLAFGATLAPLVSVLRAPGLLRAVILCLAAVATGVLGLVVAYAVVPQETVGAQELKSHAVRLVTVTGPEGTTTLAITKTKEGKTKFVPVRVLRTVTGPGGVRTLAVPVAGPPLTHEEIVTQVHHSTQTQVVQNTETQVVTEVQPVTVVVTDVVTQPETVVVTDTVVLEVTTTVQLPPGP